MGRKLHYRPGSFYRVDDRTGFPERAENTVREWDNLYVSPRVWEPRQPQDFVRGVPEERAPQDVRPLAPDVEVGPTYYQLAQAATPGVQTVVLVDSSGIMPGDPVGVMLDSGVIFRTTVISGFDILDSNGLPILDDYFGLPILDYVFDVGSGPISDSIGGYILDDTKFLYAGPPVLDSVSKNLLDRQANPILSDTYGGNPIIDDLQPGTSGLVAINDPLPASASVGNLLVDYVERIPALP